ncbi:ankyrin-2-like [Vespula squamosa]|uniref:Ankyrin-2-like n=1 Tax=Vespula squamosa TaxID=30214 RepID=A0ABD1ZWJ7_VESSQ
MYTTGRDTTAADDTTAFLRAARSGNLEKVIEYLDTDLDINTANSNGLNALHLASKDGHVEIVTELLKRGAKVDAATKKGNTALHIASLAGQAEIVSILIQYGAAVNIQSQNGFTPLYMAAQENHDQVVKLLLSNGANQSLATEDGFTPLAVAMQQGHDKVVSVLLENDSKGKVRLPALHIAAKKDDCKAADLLLQNDHKPDVTSKSGFTPLHIAAHYGNEEIARLLIKRGADVNYLAKHNISPLHVAAKWGKNNMVKILLENSAQIDAKTRDGLTPLHCAARSGHEEVVNTLLENSAPISARTKNGLAPLHMASQGDHVDAARALLYHRAPVDEVTIDYLTSLHVAAHCGHVRVAKLLLDRKADPNARALNGFTPLHIACKKNRIKVVELLLKHGASIESTTESGLTPLHVASFMGCMNIVIFLLQHEANPDVPTVRGETPLHLAARANQTDIIRILLRNGAKVDARAREQQTPLHIASRLGNIDIVMLLLQHGAAVDTTTKDMHTALHIAAKEGQEEVAAILVENNASVKATTKNGFTPLHIAAKYGNMNVAKILLQKDSKLDAQGKNDITPLHLACHYDHPNVANLLLEKGASPHLASQNGHTPLHIAARKNQMDIASTLLEGGANANAESKAGFTPLHLSSQKGHYDMTNLLIEHGADPNHKAKNGLTALHLCAQEDFVRVASILVKNDANIESQTETGYRPIHVAAHFGNLSMIRFLLKHNAEIDVRTAQNYTPLHQAAQQGHAHVVSALLEGNASHKARTNDGLTALNIAQKLGYISVMEVLKGMPYDNLVPDNKNWEEKYKVIAPESLQETSLMSDSDDEGASDALISEQPYKYLTADLMKSLRDDSLPIDVTKDDPIHRQVTKEEKQEFTQSNNYCLAENFDSNDALNLGFLVSFLVDARGGAMKGCRHSGVRIIVPPRRATMPLRVTCRLVKPSKVANPPPLMEGEALATRIIEMGPVGANFLGQASIDRHTTLCIDPSENGETWKEHDNSVDNDDTLLNTPHDPQMNAAHSGRITRIITTDFPQYFAIVTRIKQEVHVIGAEGGILMSSVANDVQAVFPPGALTKKIKVGLQAHVIPAELTAKLLGNCVAVSPVITIEPRRRKFHKPITLTIPVPQAANKGMINQYGGETPTLRLLCSIAGGTSEAQWEDVTGSTPLTFMNDRVSFTTTVSARFWLMDCRNISEVPKMATELYKESLFVPYITNFVIYSKRMDTLEATLRILCMTDGKEGMHTLERQEEFLEIVKSRDVEALHGKDLYIEFSGNLIPVTKSGVQLKFTFKAFRQNRLSFHVKVRDPLLDPVARMLFMREPKVAKGEPPQQPICVLNIVLPEVTSKIEIQKKLTVYEDSNIISQKMDFYKSKYGMEQKEKGDQPKDTSPSEEKFIADTLQKEQTDAATIHESFAQKAACPLESVDASYPNKVADQQEHDLSPSVEKQTYSEKRKFWEDISKKRESYQRSESEVSRTSQLTVNESDSEYMQNVVSEEEITEVTSVGSDTMENVNIPDISECSVAEKAHYFEEQIQKELSKVPAKLQQQDSVKPEKDKSVKVKRAEKSIDVGQMETTRDVEHEGKELKSSHVEEKDKDESDKLRKEDFKGEEIIYKERIDEFVRKEYQEKLVVSLEKKVELHREVKDIEDERKESELKKKKEEEGVKKKAAELQKKLEEGEVKRKETELKKRKEEEEAKKKEIELKQKQEEEEAKIKEAKLKKKQEEEATKKKEAELKKKQEEEEAKKKEAELKKKQEEEEAKRKQAELKKKKEEEEKKKEEEEAKKKKEEEAAKKKKEEEEAKKKKEEEEAKKKKEEEEAAKKWKEEEEAKKRKEEEEAKKRKEEEEAKKKEEEAAKKKKEEEEAKKKKEEEEAKKKKEEEAAKKRKEEEEAKKRKEEEEAKKRKEEEEAKKKKEEEEAKKRKEEEEAKKKKEEEEAKKKKEEEEAKRKEEEAAKKRKEEEEAKKKKEEEAAKKKKEEEAAKKKKEEEEAKKKKEEEEAKKKKEEEEAKKKKEEEEAKKKKEEEEAKKKKEEEEAKKKKEEEEAKKKKEEEEAKKKKEEEEAKKKKEEEEAKKKKEEEEAKRKEAELKKKEEEETRRKEVELKKKQEEEEAKRKKEEEEEAKRRKEEEEVKKKKQEEEVKRKKEEEETKRKEAELKKKQEEFEAKRRKEEEEAKKRKEEEEEVKKKKQGEEVERKKEEETKRKEAELKKKQVEEEAKRKETELKKKQEEEAKESESKRKEEMELQKEAYEELEKHIEKAALVQILPEQLERSIEETREIHQKELPEHIDRIVEKHELELQKEYLMERGESSTVSPKHSMEITSKENEFMQIHSKQTEHKEDISMQDKGLGKDISTGRRVIKEETTIIWKVQEDGSLVQEKVTKTVQIEGDEDVPEIMNVPETSLEPKVLYEEHYTVADLEEKLKEDTKIEISKKDQVTAFIPEVQKEKTEDLEKEKLEEDKIPLPKSTIESDSKLMKKEFESRIPISMAKVEKDRNHKESRSKTSIESKRLLEKSEIDKSSVPQEEPSITSPVDKKKEFESRIPKRIIDTSATKSFEKDLKKGYHVKTETETCTVTEKKSSSQETTSKSETQTFSKTFTDPHKAFKLLEDMSEKDTIKLSKVDHKASSKLEKKEVVSSEISKGADKYIVHEEKEQIECKKLSESKMKKESSTETVEKEESKSKKVDETAVQKMSINLQDGQETIDASASKNRVEAKKEQLSKKLEDKEGIMTEESGVSRMKESDIDIAVRICKEDVEKKKVEDTGEPPITSKIFEDLGKVEMVTKGESHKETVESFDARHFIPSSKVEEKLVSVKKDGKPEEKVQVLSHETLEEKQRRAAKEIEARQIVECLIESIESEIAKRSSITEDSKASIIDSNYLQQLVKESVETDHEKLADDLTKKFENIMKKTMEEQLIESGKDTESIAESTKLRSSIHEEEKRSTRDSMSISEDITKDEESSFHDKDESFLLSSSQARLPERDITMSPSSISDQIELEETMDVDTNELEDITKPTSSPQSEKLRSDRSSAQAESLQRESYEPQYDISLPKDRIIYDVSGARVLEIVEPGIDSQSRQDSVDVPSLEMDEYKISEDTGKTISSLHESAAVDSLERIAQERDMTFSPSTVSEDINVDYSLVHEQIPTTTTEKYEVSVKRADSFEIESPPLVSPRLKIRHDLEIKPVNWMIGDEKIEISETLQPSQVFNQELEEYETTIKKQRLSSQSESADLEQESATKSSEDPSVIESIKESITTGDTTVTTVIKTKKFTVIPVSDQDIESELIENKLEISCQELVDTLKREYEAKTPTEDLTISIRRPLALEEAKIKLSEMKLADSSKIETTTDQLEISTEKESIDTAKEITSVSEEKLETKEEVTSQIGKDEEIIGEPLTEKHEKDTVKDTTIGNIGLSLEEIAEPLKEDVKLLEETQTQDIAAEGTLEDDVNKAAHVDDLTKEWTEPSLTKIKVSSDDYKRHVEKGFEKRDKAARASTVTSSDTCAFKIKKDDLPGVDLSARYAITVLDQVVKKEIAEVKESLEAARQDLIEELSENSETVIQIKDSPSEFQFKLQPESIPNDLPFLYRPPSLEQIAADIEVMKTESLIASEEKPDESKRDEKEIPATESGSEEIELEASGDEMDKEKVCMDIEMELDKSETETLSAVHEESKEDDDTRPSPVPASRSCSDVEYKDESSSSLHPPQPVPRRRHKPARASKKVTSESEVDPGSSSGESSNYQSCDYEIGSGSRPSSSDVEALQSATMPPSGTTSEYETAMMSVEHSTTSRPTSQEYQTAVSTLSSRESMKSLSSFSSGHLGSIDSTSELSETLVASEADAEKGEEHEDLERAFDEEHVESDSSGSDIPMDDAMDKIDSNIPCRMKRSSEMIFQQIMDDNAALDTDLDEPILEQDTKGVDFATSAFVVTPGAVQSVDIMTARVTEDGVQSVSTQVISTQVTTEMSTEEITLKTTVGTEIEDKPLDESLEMLSMEPDSLEPKSGISVTADESAETVMQTSAHSMIQQASMSTSSTSGLSLDTVIEKAKSERSESPGSDSFELVDKPDIIDDFVVIEEVGREAEEFDSEGKSIRITAIPQVSSKQYDRDLENLITENKEDSQVSTSQTSRNNELFDFESEESPPQASNDDQYSQSYSDEEPYETGKKWIEMQFHADARVYDIEYDHGPLEDIKEEEITDFEAGSSRFGSLGSHKESIGSVGSMRGSFGSTPDYDVLAGKRYFTKPSDHDTVSLSSLQEFEHLESAVAAENSKRLQCGSQDSINNGSLPRRYMTGRSGHGDDISLSSLKDFEGLERACREAHLIELRAREEEDLLEHESPENRYKMDSLQRKSEISATGSINPSTSGSDDYEKRIKEIDEIIRIAQSNVERLDRQDDTTEDISQIEITDIEKTGSEAIVPVVTEAEDIQRAKDTNIMETSTDSLELEDNADKKHPLCQSSDSLEMKTTLDFPSLSSDSLNNVRDTRDAQLDVAEQFSNGRRMSSDSLDVPIMEQPDHEIQEESNNRSERPAIDNSVGQSSSTETNIAKQDTTKLPSSSKT